MRSRYRGGGVGGDQNRLRPLGGALRRDPPREGPEVQGDRHGYRCLRIPDMPQMEVHIVPSPTPRAGWGSGDCRRWRRPWQLRCSI